MTVSAYRSTSRGRVRTTFRDRLWLEELSRPVVLLSRAIRLTDSFHVLVGRETADDALSRRRGGTP